MNKKQFNIERLEEQLEFCSCLWTSVESERDIWGTFTADFQVTSMIVENCSPTQDHYYAKLVCAKMHDAHDGKVKVVPGVTQITYNFSYAPSETYTYSGPKTDL